AVALDRGFRPHQPSGRRAAGPCVRERWRSDRGRRDAPQARGRYALRSWRHTGRCRDRARGPRRCGQSHGEGRAVRVLSDPWISPFGDGALLVELGDGIDDALAARARALADAWDAQGQGRAVPAYASVVVRFDPLRLAPAGAERKVKQLAKTLDDVTGEPRGEIEIPTHYDG